MVRARLRWALPGAEAGAAGDEDTAGGAVPSLAVLWAGAVRANRVAKPTAVTALSWVARQVSRDSRRRPAARAACVAGPGGPSGTGPGNSRVSRIAREHSRSRVKSS